VYEETFGQDKADAPRRDKQQKEGLPEDGPSIDN
jgi:hypothetical protein